MTKSKSTRIERYSFRFIGLHSEKEDELRRLYPRSEIRKGSYFWDNSRSVLVVPLIEGNDYSELVEFAQRCGLRNKYYGVIVYVMSRIVDGGVRVANFVRPIINGTDGQLDFFFTRINSDNFHLGDFIQRRREEDGRGPSDHYSFQEFMELQGRLNKLPIMAIRDTLPDYAFRFTGLNKKQEKELRRLLPGIEIVEGQYFKDRSVPVHVIPLVEGYDYSRMADFDRRCKLSDEFHGFFIYVGSSRYSDGVRVPDFVRQLVKNTCGYLDFSYFTNIYGDSFR